MYDIRMKYIVFVTMHGDTGVMFPSTMNHDDVAENMRYFGEPATAGFAKIEDGKVVCYGRSESLNLDSDPLHDAAHFNYILVKG
jgi:hypothetical protein